MRQRWSIVILLLGLAEPLPAETPQAPRTKVVLLGTGTPSPNPDRSGPATAIVVNDTAYLVDLGPGVVRRASAAAASRGITALQPTRLRVAFLTHLHSDHTVGYPDLIFTPWTLGRRVPLEIYGPSGVKAMTEHLLEAYRMDIETRTNPEGNQRTFPEGHKVNAYEIVAGMVYKDDNVTVTVKLPDLGLNAQGVVNTVPAWLKARPTSPCPDSAAARPKRTASARSP